MGFAANRTFWVPPIAAMHGSTAVNSGHDRIKQLGLEFHRQAAVVRGKKTLNG